MYVNPMSWVSRTTGNSVIVDPSAREGVDRVNVHLRAYVGGGFVWPVSTVAQLPATRFYTVD